MRRLILSAALATLAVAPAHGASKRQVQRTLKKATKAFKAKRFDEALTLFKSVEADVVARGDFAGYRWNVARTLEELGRWDAAVAAYDHYLSLPDKPQNQASGRARKAAILKAHYGGVAVTCEVKGATVALEGPSPQQITACPATWQGLKVGTFDVVGRSPGGVDHRVSAAVKAGQTTRITVGFPALVTVKGPAGAAVTVDGRPLGQLPIGGRAVRPGWRVVTVSSPEHPRWESRVKLLSGAHLYLDATRAPAAEPREPGGTNPGWFVAAGSAALLGAGLGMYFAAADAQSQAEDAARRYNADPDPATRSAVDRTVRNHVSDFETYRALSYTGLGLGLVAGGIATWMLLDGSDEAVAVVPTHAGAAVVGRF